MGPLLAVLAALLVLAAPAAADPLPPGAHDGVELAGSLPEATRAISINFLRYADGRDVMLVSTQDGLRSYDLTADPAKPKPLDVLTKEELMLPGDQADVSGMGFWENEDMDVDQRRKLVFLSRDVLAFSSAAMGVQIVDAADPADLRLGRFVPLPSGHTTTCVNQCDFLWTAGVAASAEVWVTDVRDPAVPVVSPLPHVTERRPEARAVPSSHDVQVDSEGIAWVSGSGAVRGYRTSGTHVDPASGLPREATPLLPIPYGGGVITGENGSGERFMHNSARPGGGDVLFATEESFSTCDSAGDLVIASLKGHRDGDVDGTLDLLGQWNPGEQAGTTEDGTCSAHYLQVQDDLLVQSFYAQGTRFLDVSDPARPLQIAYFRPDDARAWAPYLHRGLVYVADNTRGVDILRLTVGTPAVPPAPAPDTTTRVTCAAAGLARVKRAVIGRRGAQIRGVAGSPCVPAVGVDVAIAKLTGRRCRHVSRTGRLGRATDCAARRWLRAKGIGSWSLRTGRRLPRGDYRVVTRVVGEGGPQPEQSYSRVQGGRTRREAVAPPLRVTGRDGFRPSPTWGWVCPLPA